MSTKTKQTQTSTTTPTNPEWVTSGAQGLAGNVQSLAGQDPQSFFAGPSDLQNQGFNLFSGLGGQASGWLNQAAQMASTPTQVGDTSLATAQSAAQNMGQYANPFQQQVIDSSMNDLNRARMLTQNGNGQGAIAAGQYGGSRQGVLDANADDSFLRNVGALSGNLNMQGFNTAAGLGAADADRFTGTSQFNVGQQNNMTALQAQLDAAQKMQGAGVLGSLGQFGASGLMDAGATQQDIAQNQASAPLTVQQMLSQSYGSLPLGLFNGQTATGTATGKTSGLGAWAQGIGGLMQGAGALGKAFG